MASKVVAVVPVKPLAAAKSRLAPMLPLRERQALVLFCLSRVLQALQRAATVGERIVIGSDEAIQRLAREMGAVWIEDPGWDLNESLRQGFAWAFARGAQACLFLPADLPLLTAEAVDGLVEHSDGLSRLVLSPAHDGGTNAIFAPQGMPFQPQMGEGSFARHLTEALERGAVVEVYTSPGLALDIDTPHDLSQLQERLSTLDAEIEEWRVFLADVGASRRIGTPLP
ncbi:MAG: 2-phospho-L-lactate guanylyltransferase [Dehalococcoidia bacterium]|nr:2-phospho-L-lactate guanylyltransferase [Dehalococcoidia bacterium]